MPHSQLTGFKGIESTKKSKTHSRFINAEVTLQGFSNGKNGRNEERPSFSSGSSFDNSTLRKVTCPWQLLMAVYDVTKDPCTEFFVFGSQRLTLYRAKKKEKKVLAGSCGHRAKFYVFRRPMVVCGLFKVIIT